jgi:hypothetical protein
VIPDAREPNVDPNQVKIYNGAGPDGKSWHDRYDARFGNDGEEGNTNAFVDRSGAKPEIVVNSSRANGGTVQHELIHTASNPEFRSTAGTNLNEGATEYFTRQYTTPLSIDRTGIYDDQQKVVNEMVNAVGKDTVKNAYFGDGAAPVDTLKNQVDAKCGPGTYDQVVAKTKASPPDYNGAQTLLQQRAPAAPPASP